ncbi:MAG: MarR family transcriptional regulator [Oscillospiraceae bacterium]|nr:MarR family transcriptional regulator [Oscillospiraceae bacterium]MCI9308622.1 MarR family transcriptional regulator [Oscillospiraceae bacterium]MCI9548782.1 MarR family transcriptional regulator [Oscillospiraceae bacterium]
MNEEERISILAVFQTLKAKTARLLEPIVQAEGLTPLQASVLLQLTRQDAAVGDISEATCMGQANASSLCKKLEQGGHLTRRRGRPDGRVVTLSLTPKGRETAQRIQRRLDHYLELLDTLPSGTKEELRQGLQAANQMLDYLFEHIEGD